MHLEVQWRKPSETATNINSRVTRNLLCSCFRIFTVMLPFILEAIPRKAAPLSHLTTYGSSVNAANKPAKKVAKHSSGDQLLPRFSNLYHSALCRRGITTFQTFHFERLSPMFQKAIDFLRQLPDPQQRSNSTPVLR